MGHENDWVIFSISMSTAFHEIDDMTEWTRRADRFYQRGGETIRAYSDRFIDESQRPTLYAGLLERYPPIFSTSSPASTFSYL